ncbi:hypothetical protein ACE15N_20205 [Xanthomonas campestris pv. passiflorae]|uniref:hypothetical protein n=1 Tax=Xanthomonas campestris TaxID=339 RepID=UPI002420E330|nr:hypothetical protein [Xanthomonas campestris]MBV6815769.1 hypothetical protein [Xanthomonas campestris pv. passiflorae]
MNGKLQKDANLLRRLKLFQEKVRCEKVLTDPQWTGVSQNQIKSSINKFFADAEITKQVNIVGYLHGCHTCKTKTATDKDQPWVGDHNPPTNLIHSVRANIGLGGVVGFGLLFPQCHQCSHRQANIVQFLNNGGAYDAGMHANFVGLQHHHNQSIPATSANVSENEGRSVQQLGISYGCHSCGTKYPSANYDADHSPPVLTTYTHFRTLMKLNNGTYGSDEEFFFRPQCKRCSTAQGGKCSSLAREAKDLAEILGITVLRD